MFGLRVDHKEIREIYELLLQIFGRQNWWPAESKFEIIAGAILTQQTSWKNVEEAIRNLKKADLLDPIKLSKTPLATLEKIVRPSGFYKQKARRLKNFSKYLVQKHNGSLDQLFSGSTEKIGEELLELDGVGPETADSMLLYAGEKPVFVVDAYTIRFSNRFGLSDSGNYRTVQELFQGHLEDDPVLLKEYHALLVELCKRYCKTDPDCVECPLNTSCAYGRSVLQS